MQVNRDSRAILQLHSYTVRLHRCPRSLHRAVIHEADEDLEDFLDVVAMRLQELCVQLDVVEAHLDQCLQGAGGRRLPLRMRCRRRRSVGKGPFILLDARHRSARLPCLLQLLLQLLLLLLRRLLLLFPGLLLLLELVLLLLVCLLDRLHLRFDRLHLRLVALLGLLCILLPLCFPVLVIVAAVTLASTVVTLVATLVVAPSGTRG
mmetsp:Transcript_31673/g.104976  ORF Transcript_31673/g.104976 Transcript_31673/m.104976 type:complete len:206 (-) Transcript_31673:1029-1646(-)